ncbi:MAG TPA: CPBP family intramembrane metalloprotease [Termitinemataceae bacterium]|nr:CPBP family intramembrane metalloprotease [Termitinemataceae bacterium]HOM22569.1 CPBP family intramembrane metalloprotease [Termitinemataceae bacterium]HPQ00075.1 CPBP family intramembrane metalloprotease [Termitinemataceae bacterium]
MPQKEGPVTFFVFRVDEALGRLLFRDLPLIVFFLLRFHLDIPTALPKLRSLRWRDFLVIPLTVFLLALTGMIIQKVYHVSTGFSGPLFQIQGPRTGFEWSILIFTIFAGAYGEEFFFRLYLLECWGRPNFLSSPVIKEKSLSGHFLSTPSRRGIFPFSWHRLPWGPLIVSSLLFALTHLYQGPLGCFQAFGAGLILSFVYLQTESVHIPALAHGIFNLLVYLWSSFS